MIAFAVVYVFLVGWLGWEMWVAPYGWEDEEGFHYGKR